MRMGVATAAPCTFPHLITFISQARHITEPPWCTQIAGCFSVIFGSSIVVILLGQRDLEIRYFLPFVS